MEFVLGFVAGMAFLKFGWPPIWEWLKPNLPKF